ncbi:HdeD family acid-resistance protein [Pendulispora albinea]|uniref:HdeD family acid-resistance protein n=1 Tax=Pendulispora albinea TaxID=2741071 RepID=A0ABZ2LV65_9BACT
MKTLIVQSDIDGLTHQWGTLVLRGILAIVFGAVALVVPGLTLLAFLLVFGVYALAEGLANIVDAVRGLRKQLPWGARLLHGIVSIAVGLIALLMPGITAIALVYYIGAWALVTGVLHIVAAIRLRHVIEGEWLLALSGLLSVAFGGLLLLAPGAGALALLLWIAGYAMAFGVLLLVLGFRLRALQRSTHPDYPPRVLHGT